MSIFQISASSNPAPLQTDIDGRVMLVIEDPQGETDCEAVDIVIFKGDTGRALFSDSYEHEPKISINMPNWFMALEAKPKKEGQDEIEEIGDDEAQMTFRYLNGNPEKKLQMPLIFSITGLVSSVGGAAEIRVLINGELCTLRKFALAKSLAGLYLRNFITRKVSVSANIPMTEFAVGDTITFSWESNGTGYKLYDGRSEQPIYNSLDNPGNPVTGFELKGIVRDTTFVLVAEMKDGTSTFELIDRITVTVSNPVLKPSSVAVSGRASFAAGVISPGKGSDMEHWQELYYPRLAAPAAGVIKDCIFFDARGRNLNMGVGQDGAFLKYEYIQIMYRLYQYLNPQITEVNRELEDVKLTVKILESYIGLHENRGTNDVLVIELRSEDMHLWRERLYRSVIITQKIADRDFIKNHDCGKGDDGRFSGKEVFHLLYQLYKHAYQTRKAPMGEDPDDKKYLVLKCAEMFETYYEQVKKMSNSEVISLSTVAD